MNRNTDPQKEDAGGDIVLSVMVTVYNHEKYIRQALDSILDQQHGYKYEILIGEDCSADGSREILREYEARYPEIIRVFFNERNIGLIKNFYNLYSHCRGRYIAGCSGDDWWLPGKVALQVGYMEGHPDTGMVYTRARFHYEDPDHRNKEEFFGQDVTCFTKIIRQNHIPAVTVLYKKSLADRYVEEVRPLERDWMMEDYPMWLWFSLNSRMAFLDNVTACYRVVENSVSHSSEKAKWLRFKASTAAIKRYYAEAHWDDVPGDVWTDYVYRSFKAASAYNDTAALAELAPEIRELHRRHPSSKTKKMAFGIRYPALYRAVRRKFNV